MTTNTHDRMLELVESFPTLRGVLTVWDAGRLDTWARRPDVSSGALHAARFVLGVWNDTDWQCGRFDFHAAYNTWDKYHRAAFLQWATDPWWP